MFAGLILGGVPFAAQAELLQVTRIVCQDDSVAARVVDLLALYRNGRQGGVGVSPNEASASMRERAAVESKRTNYVEARALYAEALVADLLDPRGLQNSAAADLSALIQIEIWRTELSQAQVLLQCALAASRSANDPATAIFKVQLAQWSAQFGYQTDAMAALEQSIAILRSAGEDWASSLAFALTTSANLRLAYPPFKPGADWYVPIFDQFTEAISAYGRDRICQGQCKELAVVQTNFAMALTYDESRLDEARRIALGALDLKLLFVSSENDSIATSYQTLAHISMSKREFDRAEEEFRRAVAILLAAQQKKPDDAISILSRVAEVSESAADFFERRGTPASRNEAILLYTISVKSRQDMRAGIKDLSIQYRRDLARAIEGPYHRLANLLIEKDRLAEAEQVLAMLKDEELTAILRAENKSVSMPLASRQQAIDYVQIATKWIAEAQRLEQLNKIAPASRSTSQQLEIDELRTKAESQKASYEHFLSTMPSASPQQLKDHTVAQTSRLAKRVKLDPSSAVALQYVVADDRVGIIVTASGRSVSKFSPISKDELNRQVTSLRKAIDLGLDTETSAQQLWKILIEPVVPVLKAAKPKTLVLSLTGLLRYLPFSILQSPGKRYLVQDYALSVWPDAADLMPAKSKKPWLIAGLGATEGLPDVATEMKNIIKKGGSTTGLIPGDYWLNESFDKRRLEASLLGSANIVHIASHFNFSPGNAIESVLVLGHGGQKISLRDIGSYEFGNIELLTLSACQTAYGDGVDSNGFEVEGLAAAVIKQQGRSVLGSLWKIVDHSTAEFMKRFYRNLAKNPRPSLARALQLTQISFIDGASSVSDMDASRWAQPKYWAPFTLSGNWL